MLDTRALVRFGDLGQPVSVAAAPDGGFWVVLLVHTPEQVALGADEAGRPRVPLLHVSLDGRTVRPLPMQAPDWDQRAEAPFGVTVDGDGWLYIGTGRRVMQVDPRTGFARTYARFPALPVCGDGATATSRCHRTRDSNGGDTRAPRAIYSAFGPDRHLYVADDNYNLIWRVPPGGGAPQVWTHADGMGLGFLGLYQLAFDPTGSRLYAAGALVTGLEAGLPATGVLLSWPRDQNGAAGPQTRVWSSTPGAGTYGVAVGRAGRVVLANYLDSSLVVLDRTGKERARVGDPLTRTRDVPPDNPSGLAWVGTSVYVANPSAHLDRKDNRALLEAYAGEQGAPLFQPRGLRRR